MKRGILSTLKFQKSFPLPLISATMDAGSIKIWLTALFILYCASQIADSSSCDKERVTKCLKKVHVLMDSQWDYISINSDKLKAYCHDLKDDAECIKNLADDCENKHKEVSILKPSIKKFKARFCKDDASEKKLFNNKIPCLVDKKGQYNNVCQHLKVASTGDVSDKKYCKKELEYIKCYGDKVEKVCEKDGRKLWEFLQEPKLDLTKGICSSSGETLTFHLAAMSFFVVAAVWRAVFFEC